MPLIRERFPDILPDMSLMVVGSVGLGIDDEYSDMEAEIYLDNPLWKEQGGPLQLALNDCLHDFCPWKKEGSIISVTRLSDLLDGHAGDFLSDYDDPPWEEVSFESLFTLQHSLILHDPRQILHSLREMTAPGNYPDRLWKKTLLLRLKKLLCDDFPEFELCVRRNRLPEASILLGLVMEGLFHLGFILCRQYYPWRTHLRWAFDRLPQPVSDWVPIIDSVPVSMDWQDKVAAMESVIAAAKDLIEENKLLPDVNLRNGRPDEELVWAERLQAWERPDWRDWVTRCTKKAVENGFPPRQFWVWSLWGWMDRESGEKMKPDGNDGAE